MKTITSDIKAAHNRNKRIKGIQAQLNELNRQIEIINAKIR